MAREDDWREERRWDRDHEGRGMDFGPTGSPGYRYGEGHDDDRAHPGYRAAREDAWLDERRRRERSFAPRDRERDERAYQPFGSTGPTAYGPYYDSPYAWGPGFTPFGFAAPFAGYSAAYGAARSDYAPDRYETGRFGAPAAGRRPGESRSFLDKAADQVSAWFGDPGAERRRREDEMRASNRGKGPKGYKRSDDRIREDVNERLTEDAYLDASDVEVSVKDGDVTLTGIVLSREDKRRAERLAEDVSGVGDVQNNLRLRRLDAAETVQAKPSAGNF